MINKFLISVFVLILGLLLSCSRTSKNELKVIATAVPHAELLEFVRSDLKAQGIDLIIIVAADYNTPNRALADKEVDANFFQHRPFLEEQIRQFHYPIKSVANIELEPMGIYSKKVQSFSELKDHAVIAIPNDPTNEGRALQLFHAQGLIELDDCNNIQATVLNIEKNPKKIQFIEVDAAMTARSLDDVDAAAINANFALQAGLSPLKDALVFEGKNSPYVNILVIRVDDEDRSDIQALKSMMNSDKMREFILEKYQQAILPGF